MNICYPVFITCEKIFAKQSRLTLRELITIATDKHRERPFCDREGCGFGPKDFENDTCCSFAVLT